MRIARFEHAARTRLGLVEDGEVIDLEGALPTRPVDLLELLTDERGLGGLSNAEIGGSTRHALESVRLLAPIARPPAFLAIARNYPEHAAEGGREPPTFPTFFNKQVTCVTGPFDPVHLPRASREVDYEGELGVVIGRRCRHVPPERAGEVVAGYLIVNDVSARDWQRRAPTMTLGKSFDTHGPTGPWLTTADEIEDPHDLRIVTRVNGDLRQDGRTSDMVFSCWEQIATLSTVCTLEPGTIIATGTPAGVGVWRDPPALLEAGDVVRIEIDELGAIENPVVPEPDDTMLI